MNDSSALQRPVPGLVAQHVGRVSDRHDHRQGGVEAGRQAEHVQVRQGPASSGSTMCSGPEQRDGQRVRQSVLRSTAGRAIAVPNGPTRGLVLKLDTTGKKAALVTQYSLGEVISGTLGDTQLLSNGNVMVGSGSSRCSPNTAGRATCCSRRSSPARTSRTALRRSLDRPADERPSGAVKTSGGSDRLRQLERGHGRVHVAGARGEEQQAPVSRGDQGQHGLRDQDPAEESYKKYQVVALGNKKQVLKPSAVFGVAKSKSTKPSSGGGGGGGSGGGGGGGGFY